jgi:hypothetical protein
MGFTDWFKNNFNIVTRVFSPFIRNTVTIRIMIE